MRGFTKLDYFFIRKEKKHDQKEKFAARARHYYVYFVFVDLYHSTTPPNFAVFELSENIENMKYLCKYVHMQF